MNLIHHPSYPNLWVGGLKRRQSQNSVEGTLEGCIHSNDLHPCTARWSNSYWRRHTGKKDCSMPKCSSYPVPSYRRMPFNMSGCVTYHTVEQSFHQNVSSIDQYISIHPTILVATARHLELAPAVQRAARHTAEGGRCPAGRLQATAQRASAPHPSPPGREARRCISS